MFDTSLLFVAERYSTVWVYHILSTIHQLMDIRVVSTALCNCNILTLIFCQYRFMIYGQASGKKQENVLLNHILIVVGFHFDFEISVASLIYPCFHLIFFFHMGIV